MCLFPTKQPLKSVAVDPFGPLPKTEAKNRFFPVMADLLTKLTQVVALKQTTAFDVAKAFASH